MKLSEEDIAYLKGLDSKKKQRKFLLDRLLESVIGESEENWYQKQCDEADEKQAELGNKISDLPRYLLPHEHEEMTRKFKEFDLGKMSIDEARELLLKGEIDMVDFIKVAFKKEDDGCVRISGLPSTEINDHVKVFHTNTTAPRTFEGFPHQYKIDDEAPSISDKAFKELWDSATPKKKEEFLKFDMLKDVTLEEIIKSKLIIRGFKSDKLTNNRGLISATINETVNEVKKCYEPAKANLEAKYTELDMVTSFYMGRQKQPRIVTKTEDGITYRTDKSFDDWFEKFKKGKENE